MKKVEPREVIALIVMLVVVASGINSVIIPLLHPRTFLNPAPAYAAPQVSPPQTDAEQAALARKTADDAAKQRVEMERESAARKAADDAAIKRLTLERQAAEDAAAEKAAAEQKAIQEATARHAADLERYLSVRIERKPGVKTVAVAVASDDGKLNRTVANALARHFGSDGVETLTSVFTQEFASDGLFAETFGGSRSNLTRLDLADSLDTIILGQETITYSQDASLENIISAHVRLEVTSMSVASRSDDHTWTLRANGAGFRRDEAKAMAEERLIKQISTNAEMALNLNPSNGH
jgi:hypothetical protein